MTDFFLSNEECLHHRRSGPPFLGIKDYAHKVFPCVTSLVPMEVDPPVEPEMPTPMEVNPPASAITKQFIANSKALFNLKPQEEPKQGDAPSTSKDQGGM